MPSAEARPGWPVERFRSGSGGSFGRLDSGREVLSEAAELTNFFSGSYCYYLRTFGDQSTSTLPVCIGPVRGHPPSRQTHYLWVRFSSHLNSTALIRDVEPEGHELQGPSARGVPRVL